MKKSPLVFVVCLVVFALLVGACDQIKEEVNQNIQKKEKFTYDLTEDWVPLLAVEYNDYQLNAVCYTDAFSFDQLLADQPWWNSAKQHIDEVEVQNLVYRLSKNSAAGDGDLLFYVFMENELPAALPLPIDPSVLADIFGDQPLAFVNPADLPLKNLVAILPITAGLNVPDWTDVNWNSGGKDQLEQLMLDFDQPFSFCISVNLPPLTITDPNAIDPQVWMKLRSTINVTLVPL